MTDRGHLFNATWGYLCTHTRLQQHITLIRANSRRSSDTFDQR